MSGDFAHVLAVAEVMRGFTHPWWFAGGWAIDLFVGRVTREHGDVEIGAFRDTQHALHEHLSQLKLRKAVDGEFVPWAAGDEIVLPQFQIQALDASLPGGELQVFFDDRDDDDWICRRDPSIRRPRDTITAVADDRAGLGGLRFLAPEIQLLFKAKYDIPKSHADFAVALPLLSAAQRVWLAAALERVHPRHAWIERL